jgi:sec-independent protein translocase protein TatA
MGLGGVSVYQLAVILLIVVVIFGTKRLKSIGGDLGGALRSFRGAMSATDELNRPAVQPTRHEELAQKAPPSDS